MHPRSGLVQPVVVHSSKHNQSDIQLAPLPTTFATPRLSIPQLPQQSYATTTSHSNLRRHRNHFSPLPQASLITNPTNFISRPPEPSLSPRPIVYSSTSLQVSVHLDIKCNQSSLPTARGAVSSPSPFMQNEQFYLPSSSPLAPPSTTAGKRPGIVPALPLTSLRTTLASTPSLPLGVKTSPLISSPRTPGIYPTTSAAQPPSAPLTSPRETIGLQENPIRPISHSIHHPTPQALRMNGYQEGRALVSNGPIQAHPGGFQSSPQPSPPQVYPSDVTSARWTPNHIHHVSPGSPISSQPHSARGSAGPYSFVPTYHTPTNTFPTGHPPSSTEIKQQPYTSPSASVYAYRPQPTVHSPYSNHPLISPRHSQGHFNFPDSRTQTYASPSSPLVHNNTTYSNIAATGSSYAYPPHMPIHGDQSHYKSQMSGGVITNSQTVRTPRGPQGPLQQPRHSEIPGNGAPRYSTQHTTTNYTPTTARNRHSPTSSVRIGGISGAMTARDSTSTTKQPQQHYANRTPLIGSARQHTPMSQMNGSQMNGSQWIGDEGSVRGRGGRGVLGKFLESLKSTLGMHNTTGTPIGKRETEPVAQETRRPKSKTPLPASSSVITPRDDRPSPRPDIQQSSERPGEAMKPPNVPHKPIADSPGSFLQSQQSSNSFKSTQTSDIGSPRITQIDHHRQQSLREDHETTSSTATSDSQPTPTTSASPSASTQKSSDSPIRIKPPRLNLSAVLGTTEQSTANTPSAESKLPHTDRLSASSPNGQYHTPMNSTPTATLESTLPSPMPTTPNSSILSPVAETPAALGATDYDAKTPGAITPPGIGGMRSYENDHSKQSSLQKYNSRISQDSSTRTSIPGAPKPVRFSWIVARALIKLQMQPAEAFSLNGVPWSLWELHKIPTLGASPTSCRVQEMYKVTIPPATPTAKRLRVFVKSIPVAVWRKQWENQNKWGGEYVTDGENFVMEAAALAFLQQYGPDLAPRLLGVLELSGPVSRNSKSQRRRGSQTQRADGSFRRDAVTEVTHVVIVSELYGEDLLDFLERREKEKIPLTESEKKSLQLDCICLLKRLHHLGLAHLDFTPENVLYGRHGLRLCDFAKATPIWSNNFRHIKADSSHGVPPFSFESCEPTVGKGAYMPPECWKVYWRLEDTRIQYPLEELWSLTKPTDRVAYYFRADRADVYMAGVLLFWLWSEGGIWKCSDVKQDEKYNHLVKSGLNFDLFRECRSWPSELKDILRAALRPDPRQRTTLEELINHSWFSGCTPSQTRERWIKMASFQHSNPPPLTRSNVNETVMSQSEMLSNRVEAAH